jgi:hypothetical protein
MPSFNHAGRGIWIPAQGRDDGHAMATPPRHCLSPALAQSGPDKYLIGLAKQRKHHD